MALIEPGRVCIKRKGREAGKKVVVTSVKGNYAFIEGTGVKKRRCNITHLYPTAEKKKV
ncbi:MAG: 50S ribosomal protein L14e [archaeon]